MVDSNVKTGIRRSVIGMAGSLCFGLYGVFVLVSIAMGGPASGGDAVAAALGSGWSSAALKHSSAGGCSGGTCGRWRPSQHDVGGSLDWAGRRPITRIRVMAWRVNWWGWRHLRSAATACS